MIGKMLIKAGEKILPKEETLCRFFENRNRCLAVSGIAALISFGVCVWMLILHIRYSGNWFSVIEGLSSFVLYISLGEFAACAGKKISLKRYFTAAIITAAIFFAATPPILIVPPLIPDQFSLEMVGYVVKDYCCPMYLPALVLSLLLGRFVLHRKPKA